MSKMLALVLSTFALLVQARETVTIYYAFSPADTMANYSRTLVDAANRIQDKYTFVFDTKPGAGNAIAANFVRNTPNTILATSSAFFVRPNFYPNESYNINDFKELMPQCDAPLGVASAKYQTWGDVPRDRPINIGVSGLGVTTHLAAMQIVQRYPNIQVIPFKSTTDSIIALAGGQIELHIGFLGEAETWGRDDSKVKVHVLGTTGSKSVNGHATLTKQGFPAVTATMNAPHHLVVPANISPDRGQEWRDILVKAAKSKQVQDSYAVDHCISMSDMSDNEIQSWYAGQTQQWKKLSAGIKINQ